MKRLRPLLFVVVGALIGLGYYLLVGCSTGTCPITSNPWLTMGYTGFIGYLLSGIFSKNAS